MTKQLTGLFMGIEKSLLQQITLIKNRVFTYLNPYTAQTMWYTSEAKTHCIMQKGCTDDTELAFISNLL